MIITLFSLRIGFQASQSLPDIEGIRQSMNSLPGLAYCLPTQSAPVSLLGKRSAPNNTDDSGEHSETTGASMSSMDINMRPDDNKLMGYVQSITNQQNPLSAAWLIHQSAMENDPLPGGDDGLDGSSNVPLHIACGYIDEIFNFTDIPSDLHQVPILSSHFDNFPGDISLASHESNMGAWPFNDNHGLIPAHDMQQSTSLGDLPGFGLPLFANETSPCDINSGGLMNSSGFPNGQTGIRSVNLLDGNVPNYNNLVGSSVDCAQTNGGHAFALGGCNLLALSSSNFHLPVVQQQQQNQPVNSPKVDS